jgi:hypothetical protein
MYMRGFDRFRNRSERGLSNSKPRADLIIIRPARFCESYDLAKFAASLVRRLSSIT